LPQRPHFPGGGEVKRSHTHISKRQKGKSRETEQHAAPPLHNSGPRTNVHRDKASLELANLEKRQQKRDTAMQRLGMLAGHLAPEDRSANASSSNNVCTRSDCVIVAAKRSPFGKAGKGGLSQVPVEDLVSPVFRALLADKNGLHVDEVLIGKVAGDSGQGHMAVRRAMFIAGLDESTSCAMMNRACASGLETIATMHAKITTNQVKVGIAG
jgi:hypothetical protein